MIIKNLTSEVKEIKLREFASSTIYSCYIEPYGQTELDRMILLNPVPQGVEITGHAAPISEILHPIFSEDQEVEEKTDPQETKDTEDEPAPPEVNKDKFICDECGAEFASARSLASHKSRSHNKQEE